MSYPAHIDKEDVAQLPACRFPGKIVIVKSHLGIRSALNILKKSTLVGFDTETRPTFKKGVHATISLLQLSTKETAFLFRLKEIGPDGSLKRYLQDDKYQKVGISVHDDFLALNQWMKCEPKGFIDLQKVAPQYGIEEMSLRKMHAIVMGEKISKKEQLSNWDSSELTESQQLYAATDAWACINIYEKLTQQTSE